MGEPAEWGVTMANKTRSTFAKRQKELARAARQKDKQARRLEAKQKQADGEAEPVANAETEDPDLVGIRLGRQPSVDEDEADGDGAESKSGR